MLDHEFYIKNYSVKELLKISLTDESFINKLISQISKNDEFCIKNLDPLINHQIEYSWVFDYLHYNYNE